MESQEKDRVYYETGIAEMEQYLLSTELYWPLRTHTADLTQLTPGGLLLVQARLRGVGARGLESLGARLEAVRSKWRSAWEDKTRREVRARGELWHGYLGEYRREAGSARRLYPQNVRQRAMLALLGEEADALDDYLRSVLLPGAFVWDVSLRGGFPRNEFWFLYGTLKP